MAAYKHQDGNWRYRTGKKITNPFTGESRRLSGTPAVNTKKHAEDAERVAIDNFMMDPALRPVPADSFPLVKEVAEKFREHMDENPEHSPTYITKVECNLDNHLIPDLGDLRISALNEEVLRNWKKKLVLKTKGLRGAAIAAAERGVKVKQSTELIKPRTVKDILRVCHGMMVYAVEERLIPAVPRFPEAPKPLKKAPDFYTLDEVKRLLLAAHNEDDRLLLRFAIQTGLRQGEQMAFRWSDCDFENNRITVRQQYKKGKDKVWRIGPPKGNKERTIDVVPSLMLELRAYRHLKGELIFSNDDGGRLTQMQMTHKLRRAIKSAGIKKIKWHDLRHTYGSQAAMAGADLRQIQQWMGHASITTTEIYAHFMPDRGQAQAKKLVEIWG